MCDKTDLTERGSAPADDGSNTENDFSKGSIARNILSLALPMTLAQLINVLYSVVDRIYIGHIPHVSADALTGVGLTLPIITVITAFSNLFGMGGAPLCSIARGGHEEERAEDVMGNSFAMLLISGIILMTACLVFRKPLLYLFGASDVTYPYADQYISIYLCGTLFVMISLGMNNFINAQGFGKTGMLTVLLGAVLNIILDPILIFGFGSQGSGGRYGHLAGGFGAVGLSFPDREESDSETEETLHASAGKPCKRDHPSGNLGLCHVGHQRTCPDRVQRCPCQARRRPLRGSDDGHQLCEGDHQYAFDRTDVGSPAGDRI